MILPFGLAYIVNWVMFLIIMVSICKHTQGSDNSKTEKFATVKKNVAIALTLAVVFGLGWGIGLAATSGPVQEVSLAFQIVFSILVGSQGVLIFLLHGLRNKDVRNHWMMCFSRIGGKSLLDSVKSLTKTSTAGTHSTLRGKDTSSSAGTMSLTQKKFPVEDNEYVESQFGDTTKIDLTQ